MTEPITVRVGPFTVGHESYAPTADELPAELRGGDPDEPLLPTRLGGAVRPGEAGAAGRAVVARERITEHRYAAQRQFVFGGAHEGFGQVIAVGPNVSELRPGDRGRFTRVSDG